MPSPKGEGRGFAARPVGPPRGWPFERHRREKGRVTQKGGRSPPPSWLAKVRLDTEEEVVGKPDVAQAVGLDLLDASGLPEREDL